MARTVLTLAELGAARQLQYRELADRPRERSAPEGSGAPRLWTPAQRAACTIERAAAGSASPGTARFEGFASVTGKPYEMYDWLGRYDEQVAVGSFEQTLSEDPHTPLVIDHTSSRRLALTGNLVSPLELAEVVDGETTGLRSVAPTMPLSDPDVTYITPKLESGLIDEMSFRFTIEDGRWSEDFTTFTITRVNINRGDVSIVGYGANPHTAGAGLRTSLAEQEARQRARERAAAMSLMGDTKYARMTAL